MAPMNARGVDRQVSSRDEDAAYDSKTSSPSANVATPISSRPPSFSSLDPLDDGEERHTLSASFQLDEDDEDEDDNDNEQSRLHPRTSTDSSPALPLSAPSPFEEI